MKNPAPKDTKIILIDGSSYFFRAFFAIQRLTNSQGFPTNAILGFLNMLMKVIDEEKPAKLGIAFDTPKPSFRKQMYAQYKATRQAPPEDLVVQIPHIIRAVDAFGICRLERPGFEADDVIATLAHRARAEGYPVEIISADKDLMQLITDSIHMYDSMKDKRYGPKDVEEKYGVGPEKMVDLLALMGDSSDNIPGVAGIGPKTAAQLLKEFGSLKELYERLGEIKQEKRRQTLLENKENAFLSQKLVVLKDDVPLEFSWADLDYHGPQMEKLQPILEEFELTGLMKRFGMKTRETSFKRGKYTTVLEVAQLEKLAREIRSVGFLSLDTETTSLNPHDAELVGISFAWKEAEAYYLPLGHRSTLDSLAPRQIPQDEARRILGPIFEDASIAKIGQNLKYDYQVLKRWGVALKGIQSDTLLASYVLDPEKAHGLDALAKRVLGHQNITYEEVAGKGKEQVSFADVDVERATEYSGEDADVALRLHNKLVPDVKKEHLTKVYEEIEIPLVPILAEMEYAGIRVDADKLHRMNQDLDKEVEKLRNTVHQIAGEEFNLNSPKQLSTILFEKLKLPVVKKTKTGNSTDENVLRELSTQHDIAAWILKHRELVKLKSTYVEGLLNQIHPSTGRVHTHFNQTVAATGRLSSSEPNLQNIPISRDDGYDIRSVFVASPGCELFFPDYSQVELRVLAHMSDDKELCRAFRNNEDIHAFTARLIFGGDKVTADQRRVAKTINFGVVYGQTPFGLSRQLKISTSEAKKFIDSYFERYSGVRDCMNGIVESARKNGYVTTLMGRRRYVAEIDSKNRMRREMAERAAINSPIQGTAADMIKLAMIAIDKKLREGKFQSQMLLQVHDELVFEVVEKEKSKIEELVLHEMQNAIELKVPLRVDTSWGQTWTKTAAS